MQSKVFSVRMLIGAIRRVSVSEVVERNPSFFCCYLDTLKLDIGAVILRIRRENAKSSAKLASVVAAVLRLQHQ